MYKNPITLIEEERHEQINKHGRTIEHDIKNNALGQLADAAQKLLHKHPNPYLYETPYLWDGKIWHKMCNKSYSKRLIIVGALVAAEFDRINFKPEKL